MDNDRWLVIVCDSEDTGSWTILVDSVDEKNARDFEADMIERKDTSPRIVLFTGDFVQV